MTAEPGGESPCITARTIIDAAPIVPHLRISWEPGTSYRYAPKPTMTGYQAGMIFRLISLACSGNWSSALCNGAKLLMREVYEATAEHWEEV